MLSKPVSTQVVLALALAILMAWVGHTAALVVDATRADRSSHESAHTHGHDLVVVCAACADHLHSPLTADHVHETAHLPVLVRVSVLPERRLPLAAPFDGIPSGSVDLIERPPRSTVVI